MEFDPANSEHRPRLDAEWLALTALREAFTIARKASGPLTYQETIAIAEEILPNLFNSNTGFLSKQPEPRELKRYQQLADAQSRFLNRRVEVIEVVNARLSELNPLLEVATPENASKIRKERNDLIAIINFLAPPKPKGDTETAYIESDVYQAHRYFLNQRLIELNPLYQQRNYNSYQLPDGRQLHLHILHPDRGERFTGTDLIYEFWDPDKGLRLVTMQYKIWDGKDIYYNARNQQQLDKLEVMFCKRNNCLDANGQNVPRGNYRLPFCTAFFRPTDKLQSPNARLVSTGYHLRICHLKSLWQTIPSTGGKELTPKTIKTNGITHPTFDHLFSLDMLGSRWFTELEVEKLYQDYNLLAPGEHLTIYAQEFAS